MINAVQFVFNVLQIISSISVLLFITVAACAGIVFLIRLARDRG